ncbi:MAG: PBSX family phage terminase large subunit [Alphaproteobacteria bacterium]|nr:PBSX family phage terminase large subunit [Alphaproteobacteria bacterium]
MQKQLKIKIARPFLPLINEKKRIKFFYGGRGGGKSYAFADSLLLLGLQKKLLVACLREIQESIKDSVHRLLSERISFYGLDEFEVKETEILNRINGTRFIFKGLRSQDIQKIKSLEGVDIAWIEEAQTISKKSWEILAPTIRKDGSEIWISMNRIEENDPLWILLAAHPDERTLVCRVNYNDNPFCPDELKKQALACRQKSPSDYAHIWEGEPLRQGDYKLIDAHKVRLAMSPKIKECSSPLVIGLDVARFGDDSSVFCFRRGRLCFKLEVYDKKDTVELANIATNIIGTHKPQRIFLDAGGVGGGVYDILRDRGFKEVVKAVNFGAKAINDERYGNKRAEMWDMLREWFNEDVELISNERLYNELCAVNKKYDHQGRLLLEEKEEIKKRLGHSTDLADALALTFAEPVYDRGRIQLYGNGKVIIEDMFCEHRQNKSGW